MDLNIMALLLVVFSAGVASARWSLTRHPVPKIQKWMLGLGIATMVFSCCYGSSGRDLQFALPPLHPFWAFLGAAMVALGMTLLLLSDVSREYRMRRVEKARAAKLAQN